MKPKNNRPIYACLNKVLICLFFFLVSSIGVTGQSKLQVISTDTLILNGKVSKNRTDILEYFKVYYDSTNKLTFQQILQKASFKHFSKQQAHNKNTTWLRFIVKNRFYVR